ncbi:MAG: outer membrane lipoprotein LolB [Hylemonella sp.]|nr:outer membrane lipoprotein LolB [Hylemonella sp.]
MNPVGLTTRRAWLCAAAVLLSACAQKPLRPPQGGWSGRMSLQVDSEPGQSFFAGFDLRGDPQTGELALYTPWGSTLAVLAWTPGSATLTAEDKVRSFSSLDVLLTRVTGAPIPVGALFDWLAGRASAVPGWQPDLSQLAQGRLSALRTQPLPSAELRLVLDK